MSEPTAVQRAVELLRSRLDEARLRRDDLSAEITTIEGALNSLSVFSSPGDVSASPVRRETVLIPRPQARSVRAAVKAILDETDHAYTPAEIRGLIPDVVMDGKSNEQRTNSVRTALWSLRKKGEAELIDEVRTKSTKWSTPESSSPEHPAENGSGTFAFTEAQP